MVQGALIFPVHQSQSVLGSAKRKQCLTEEAMHAIRRLPSVSNFDGLPQVRCITSLTPEGQVSIEMYELNMMF